jgi:hypothetical protein
MIELRPIIIDPDAWYSDGQARLLLDLPGATLVQARRIGTLRYTRLGHRIMYLGRWLTAWLESVAEGRDHAD